jgi:hypothetical protein
LLRPSLVWQGDTKLYDRLDAEVRAHIEASRTLIELQKNEVSLLPRPIKLYAEVVDASERMIEIMAEIRLLRFSVPRKPAVFDIMPIRREMVGPRSPRLQTLCCALTPGVQVSAILVNLWALCQCFRSRSPLPQYLPSPRTSLDGLMLAMDDLARAQAAEVNSPTHGDQLGILYGMAENEAIGELCTVLEELVAAAGTLFGTRTFVVRLREEEVV